MAALGLLAVTDVAAQSVVVPSGQRVPLPLERPFRAERGFPETRESEGEVDLGAGAGERVLPTIPAPSAAELEALGARAGLVIRELELSGNTVFSDERLTASVATYLGRPLDSTDLERIRRALTAVYVEAGYVNSGASLPEQVVEGGRLRIEITEGTLEDIRILGTRRHRPSVLRARLARAAGPPVRVGELEAALRILSQDPRIARLDARLEPGARPGTSILHVEIEEHDPGSLEVAFDNYETPSVGELAGNLSVDHLNPLGWGDEFGANLTVTEGLVRVDGRYAVPVHPSGTKLTFDTRFTHAEITDSAVNLLDIASESLSHAFGLGQTLYRTPRDWLEAGVSLDLRRSRSTLGGRSFSFVDGTENGRSELTVLRGDASWTRRLSASALAVRTLFSVGLDAFGATMHDDGDLPSGEFFSWIGQLRFLHRFEGTGVEVGVRGDLQLSDRPLLPLEQFALGGPGSVRGYQTNEQAGDQGFSAGLDVRVPLLRTATGRDVLSVIPFADVGRAWNQDRSSRGLVTLPSFGAGVEWAPRPFLSFRFDWGGALQSFDSEDSIQAHGVTFRVAWRPR